VDRFSKLVVNLIIVALAAVASVAPASGGVFFFENNLGITINDSGPATPYPSTINVSGLTGRVTHMVVGLTMSHTFPDHVEILLVAPSGLQTAILMSDAGGGVDMNNVNLIFSDCARRLLSNQGRIDPGRYRPSSYSTFGGLPSLPSPAPAGPYGPGLAEFNGLTSSAEGTWSLFVNDNTAGNSGFISAWNITIFTNPGPLPGPGNPVPCGKPDFDGDGRADTVVYQDATGNWFVVGSAVGFFTPALNFGGPGFISVAGDYDGDGITDPAVYHTSSGNWFAVGSSTGFFNVALNFGGPGFTPVPGDYDGDGKTDAAVYQTSTGNWFVVGSTDGFFSVLNFGGSGFSPVPAAQ
jgi:subtilisin-like proprotein convertase family protein